MGVRPGLLESAWVRVALVALALLAVPALVWLLIPAPEIAGTTATSTATVVAAPPDDVEEDDDPAFRILIGTVIDEAGDPVEGAVVRYQGRAGERAQARSDEDGSFKLVRVPLGAGSLSAEKGELGRASESVPASSEAETLTIDLQLLPVVGVGGRVVDERGRPVADARVECDPNPDDTLADQTDGNGEFSLPPEAEGCTAVATHVAYGPSIPSRLASGDGNRLQLGEPGSISGIVMDEAGRPLTSFSVGIESYVPPDGSERPSVPGRSRQFNDPTGAFEINELPAGTYILAASAPGRPPTNSEGVEVVGGRDAVVRITVPTGASLSGSVTDRDTGEAIAGATVALDGASYSGGNTPTLVSTDGGGRFVLDGVPPSGPFSVKVSHADYRDRIETGLDARGLSSLSHDFDLARKTEDGGDSELAGIGALLAPGSDGTTLVAQVFDGGPAAEAGLESSDRVIAVDGDNMEGQPLAQVVQLLRGPEGTRVTVTVDRDGETLDISITRGLIVR